MTIGCFLLYKIALFIKVKVIFKTIFKGKVLYEMRIDSKFGGWMGRSFCL